MSSSIDAFASLIADSFEVRGVAVSSQPNNSAASSSSSAASKPSPADHQERTKRVAEAVDKLKEKIAYEKLQQASKHHSVHRQAQLQDKLRMAARLYPD